MSQVDLALRAGLTDGALYLIERGKSRPHMRNRVRLAEVLIEADPLTSDEFDFLADALSLERSALDQIQRDMAVRKGRLTDATRERLYRELDRLIERFGPDDVKRGMISMASALQMLQEDRDVRPLRDAPPARVTSVVKAPHVQRDGYVEESETHYEQTDPAKPTTRARRTRRA